MQKKSLILLVCLLASATMLQISCKKDEKCTTENMSFKKNILPLLEANKCLDAGCHNATTSASFPYDTYERFKLNAVDSKRVLGAIKHEAGFSKMPKTGGKIDDCDISQIEAWITQGAKDN